LSNLTLFKGRGTVIDDVAEMSCVPTYSTWANIFHVFADFENLFGYVSISDSDRDHWWWNISWDESLEF
jgi:hypothetical protein